MQETKFTPGPWVVVSYSGPMYAIHKPDFKPGDEVISRVDADRALIQAAPTVYEFTEAILEWAQKNGQPGIAVSAGLTLAKARGE